MFQWRNPTAKRLLGGLLVAVLGAVILILVASPAEAQVHYPNICAGYGPGDWQYWFYGCWSL